MLFLAFGPMIVTGVYIVLAGQFSWEALIISLVPGVFTMNIGVVSNTFDYLDDIKSGKRTFSVRFGQQAAVRLIMIGSVIAYLAIVIGAAIQLLPVWTLLVLITIPLSFQVVKHASQYEDESHYTPAMTRAIALSSVASLLLIAAYGIVILAK
jgi:1,4-dihydroxy-2-naphthoate octaprenyltransferase